MTCILKLIMIISAFAITLFFTWQNKIYHKGIKKGLSCMLKKNPRILLKICKTMLVFQKDMRE